MELAGITSGIVWESSGFATLYAYSAASGNALRKPGGKCTLSLYCRVLIIISSAVQFINAMADNNLSTIVYILLEPT